MLLLGITLTVGFYEGRRLVTNTMRALQIGEASEGLAARLEPDAAEAGARREEKPRSRTSPRPPMSPDASRPPTSRSRHRARPGEPQAPLERLEAAKPDGTPLLQPQPAALPVQPPAEDTGQPLK
jgi:hypothetical protein